MTTQDGDLMDQLDGAGEMALFLADLRSLAEGSAPTPSDELASMLAAPTRAPASLAARRRGRVAGGAALLATAGLAGTGWAAAANELPPTVQTVVADFADRFLHLELPRPAHDPEAPVGGAGDDVNRPADDTSKHERDAGQDLDANGSVDDGADGGAPSNGTSGATAVERTDGDSGQGSSDGDRRADREDRSGSGSDDDRASSGQGGDEEDREQADEAPDVDDSSGSGSETDADADADADVAERDAEDAEDAAEDAADQRADQEDSSGGVDVDEPRADD